MTDTNEPAIIDDHETMMETPSELDSLKKTADNAGIKYSPNIGLKTLRDKVNEKLSSPTVKAAPKKSTYQTLKEEATRLIRVRITNINPNKKHSEGEYFRVGNSVITTIARFVPFDIETHVEHMLLNLIKNRKFAIVQEKKNSEGVLVPIRSTRNEFQVEILPALTQKELEKLASDQSKRQSI